MRMYSGGARAMNAVTRWQAGSLVVLTAG